MPLLWAHAEYIKLLRSAIDGQVFDFVAVCGQRYFGARKQPHREVWKFNRRVRAVPPNSILRIQAPAAFRLRWSGDNWAQVHDTPATQTLLGISFVDLPVPREQRAPIRFTFFWTEPGRWEGRDFEVAVGPAES
jgi:glucoamylase